MTALLLAVVVLLVAAAPAAAGPACPRKAGGPPLGAEVRRVPAAEPAPQRRILLACDHRTGRGRVLRRVVTRDGGRRGTVLADLSVAGGRVAWLEAALGRRGAAYTAVVADARTGRIVRRRRVLATTARDTHDLAGIALTTRGDLAWTVGRGVGEMQVVHLPPRGAARVLASGRVWELRAEDDATLIWQDDLGHASHDLPGVDFGAGCPKRRSRFRPDGQPGEVVFTTAVGPAFAGQIEYLRACDTRTGVDAIVGAASELGGFGGEYLTPRGGGNGWAAVAVLSGNRYEPCARELLVTVEIATRRVGRGFSGQGCGPPPVPPRTVVTNLGAPAWIEGEGADTRLLAVDTGNALVELDRGAIDGLRAEDEEVLWTKDGEARRARP